MEKCIIIKYINEMNEFNNQFLDFLEDQDSAENDFNNLIDIDIVIIASNLKEIRKYWNNIFI